MQFSWSHLVAVSKWQSFTLWTSVISRSLWLLYYNSYSILSCHEMLWIVRLGVMGELMLLLFIVTHEFWRPQRAPLCFRGWGTQAKKTVTWGGKWEKPRALGRMSHVKCTFMKQRGCKWLWVTGLSSSAEGRTHPVLWVQGYKIGILRVWAYLWVCVIKTQWKEERYR